MTETLDSAERSSTVQLRRDILWNSVQHFLLFSIAAIYIYMAINGTVAQLFKDGGLGPVLVIATPLVFIALAIVTGRKHRRLTEDHALEGHQGFLVEQMPLLAGLSVLVGGVIAALFS